MPVQSTPIQAYKAKSKEPYSFTLNEKHVAVLRQLATDNRGQTDSELTFALRMHMAAPRRCELRDAGAVEFAGSRGGSKAWRLTAAGWNLLTRIRAGVAA